MTPLAEAIAKRVASGSITWSHIAHEMGWTNVKVVPDIIRVQRRLGLKFNHGHKTRAIDYATAVKMAEAAGLDPYEAGL